MTTTAVHAPGAPDAAAPVDRWKVVRRVALAIYLVAFLVGCFTIGVPIGRDRVIAWTMGGLACASIGKSWRQILWLVLDWVGFALVLVGYDLSRGWADSAGFGVHFEPQLRVDEILFFGHVPTVWLQDHLYDVVVTATGRPRQVGPVQWYHVLFDLTYVSHYLFAFILAGVLWVKERRRFLAFARRFVTLSYLGFVTYALFPAAPPWMAAQEGYLPERVGRLGGGLSKIGLSFVRDLIDKNIETTNTVAAVPSLHHAFTVLIVITLWQSVPRWGRPLLVGYPVVMCIALMAKGEHYFSDILLGVIYAFFVHWAWTRIERWWSGRKSSNARTPEVYAAQEGHNPPTFVES